VTPGGSGIGTEADIDLRVERDDGGVCWQAAAQQLRRESLGQGEQRGRRRCRVDDRWSGAAACAART
jgi:hypothetical protein